MSRMHVTGMTTDRMMAVYKILTEDRSSGMCAVIPQDGCTQVYYGDELGSRNDSASVYRVEHKDFRLERAEDGSRILARAAESKYLFTLDASISDGMWNATIIVAAHSIAYPSSQVAADAAVATLASHGFGAIESISREDVRRSFDDVSSYTLEAMRSRVTAPPLTGGHCCSVFPSRGGDTVSTGRSPDTPPEAPASSLPGPSMGK